MSDQPATPAVAWIETLTARGVTLQARGKNVAFSPKTAYASLTNDERIFAKQYKAEIVSALRNGYGGTARPVDVTASSIANAAPAAVAVAPVEPCRWCNRAPCIGPEHPAFADLHPEARPKPTYDLAALRRSNDGLLVTDNVITPGTSAPDETDVMMKQIGKPLPDWWWQ